jgi:chaperone protein EcpD
MANLSRFFASAGCLVAMAAGVPAYASAVIQGTRVVYPSDAREVSIKISNPDKMPLLVQSWLDNRNEQASPGQAEVPFTLTPPMSRIDPGKSQTLRLSYTGEPLAKDKETLYWLNVLSIPPKSQVADGVSQLQFSFRTRMKVFFRPAGLPYPVTEAPAKLTWKLIPANKGYALEVNNPTPYHVSFSSVALKDGERSFTGPDSKGMVAPGETTRFPAIAGINSASSANAKVVYQIINDQGGYKTFESPLNR